VKEGWGCSSVVEYFPSIHEALGSISSTTKNKQTNKQTNKTKNVKDYEALDIYSQSSLEVFSSSCFGSQVTSVIEKLKE
jgi:hypothetical protein